MTLSEAISELAQHMNLPDLALDENHLAGVQFDEDLAVTFEGRAEDDHLLRLSGVLGQLGDGEGAEVEAWLEKLLHGNLLGLATGGAHFSLARSSGEILLERTLNLDGMDFTDFSQALESFVNQLEGWRGEAGEAAGVVGNGSHAIMNGAGLGMLQV